MALELEQTIMREIGLGQHYYYYNGSGSCWWIAKEAVRRLPEVIQRHADAGEPIAPPNKTLMGILATISVDADTTNYELTHTWQAASDVIRAHMEAHTNPARKVFQKYAKYLREHYLGISKQTYSVWPEWRKGGVQ